MKKLLVLGAALAAMAFPATSRAQFQLGLRLGYAPAMGDAAKDWSMSDAVKSQIPIQLDAGYKLTPELAVGAYFSYGFGASDSLVIPGVGDVCGSGVDCSSTLYRAGVQGLYTFTQVKSALVPWAGVGIGYEWASLTAEGGGMKAEFSTSGMEYLNLQVGGDYKVSPKFAIGPYALFSLAKYSSATVKVNGNEVASGSIDQQAMHEWLHVGVRGSFDL